MYLPMLLISFLSLLLPLFFAFTDAVLEWDKSWSRVYHASESALPRQLFLQPILTLLSGIVIGDYMYVDGGKFLKRSARR